MGYTSNRQELLGPILVKPPLFIFEHDSIDIFATVAEAEQYLEPHDAGDLVVFDGEGRVMSADVVQDEFPVFLGFASAKRMRVVIREIEPPRVDPELLKAHLRNYLPAVDTSATPLSDMVNEAVRTIGYTR